ncbi:hypothetical protein ANRL1_04029 [Anaerolineae bacterium]|nr:hypothetical protein ANRL1_04029 [Anaerolineae bacterium]
MSRKSPLVMEAAQVTGWQDFVTTSSETAIVPVGGQSIQPHRDALNGLSMTEMPSDLKADHCRLMHAVERHNLPVKFAAYAPMVNHPIIFRCGERFGFDMVLIPIELDPTYDVQTRTLQMPVEAQRDLVAIRKAKIDFDELFIAHEVRPYTIQAGEPVPAHLVRPDVSDIRAKAQSIADGASDPAGSFWSLVRGTWDVVDSVGSAGLRAGSAAANTMGRIAGDVMNSLNPPRPMRTPTMSVSSSTSYDPILFGVIANKRHKMNGSVYGRFYRLTHWYWTVEGGW